MSFLNTLMDLGDAKSVGLDAGELAGGVFGNNAITDTFNKFIDFGKLSADSQREKERQQEEERKRREAETKALNERSRLDALAFSASQKFKQTDNKTIFAIIGGVVVVIVLFLFKGGKK